MNGSEVGLEDSTRWVHESSGERGEAAPHAYLTTTLACVRGVHDLSN